MKELHTARMFLIRDDQVLLGKKKYGMGEAFLMGMGGKMEPGETQEQAAIRETREESGLTPIAPTKVAQINCHLHDDSGKWVMVNHIFVANDWEGELSESNEMVPEWFFMDMIPFPAMWADNSHWLPLILEGNGVVGDFMYDEDEQLVDHSYEIVDIEQVPR